MYFWHFWSSSSPSPECSVRVARFHWRFRPQLVAIACRPVLKNDMGFFSYEIQTFKILYNADKVKNLLFNVWKTSLVESYQFESWSPVGRHPSTLWPEPLDFVYWVIFEHIVHRNSPPTLFMGSIMIIALRWQQYLTRLCGSALRFPASYGLMHGPKKRAPTEFAVAWRQKELGCCHLACLMLTKWAILCILLVWFHKKMRPQETFKNGDGFF